MQVGEAGEGENERREVKPFLHPVADDALVDRPLCEAGAIGRDQKAGGPVQELKQGLIPRPVAESLGYFKQTLATAAPSHEIA